MRFSLFLALLLVLLAAPGDLLAAEPALRMVKTIRLPDVSGRIDHMAIDPGGNLLFIAALGNNSIEGMDLQSGKIVARATRTREPQGICIVDQKVFVASGGDGMVRAFDEKLHELAHIDGLTDADNVRFDAPSDLIYVGYGESGKAGLAIIDPKKMTKIGEIALPSHPESFQISPDGKRIWANLPAEKQVMVIDTSERKVIDHWTLPVAANFPMALDHSRHRLLVASRDPPKLLLFDVDSGKLAQAIETTGDADDVWTDAPAGFAFVTGGEGFVDVYQWQPDHALKLIDKIRTDRGARTSLFDSHTRRLYVAVPRRGERIAEVRVFQFSSP